MCSSQDGAAASVPGAASGSVLKRHSHEGLLSAAESELSRWPDRTSRARWIGGWNRVGPLSGGPLAGGEPLGCIHRDFCSFPCPAHRQPSGWLEWQQPFIALGIQPALVATLARKEPEQVHASDAYHASRSGVCSLFHALWRRNATWWPSTAGLVWNLARLAGAEH